MLGISSSLLPSVLHQEAPGEADRIGTVDKHALAPLHLLNILFLVASSPRGGHRSCRGDNRARGSDFLASIVSWCTRLLTFTFALFDAGSWHALRVNSNLLGGDRRLRRLGTSNERLARLG